MKVRNFIYSIASILMTVLAGCSGEVLAPMALTGSPEPAVSETSAASVASLQQKSAWELLQEVMPSDEEILAEIIKYKNSSSKNGAAARIALVAGSPQIIFMALPETIKIYDGATNQPQALTDPVEEGDYAHLDYRVYYEESGDNPIVIEGFLRWIFVFSGGAFVPTASQVQLEPVTARVEGTTLNQLRCFAEGTRDCPLGGVSVLFTANNGDFGLIQRTAVSGADGRYSLLLFAGREYAVSAFADGFQSHEDGSMLTPVAGVVTEYNIELWPVEQGQAQVAYLPLRGRVLDLNGNPVAGALVKALDYETGELILSTSSAGTGADGSWELLLPDGVDRLKVEASFKGVAELIEVPQYPTAQRFDITLQLAPPVCESFTVAPEVVTIGGTEVLLTATAQNPIADRMYYQFDEFNHAGEFPLGMTNYNGRTIWLPPSVNGSYLLGVRVANSYGECQLTAEVTVEIFE